MIINRQSCSDYSVFCSFPRSMIHPFAPKNGYKKMDQRQSSCSIPITIGIFHAYKIFPKIKNINPQSMSVIRNPIVNQYCVIIPQNGTIEKIQFSLALFVYHIILNMTDGIIDNFHSKFSTKNDKTRKHHFLV